MKAKVLIFLLIFIGISCKSQTNSLFSDKLHFIDTSKIKDDKFKTFISKFVQRPIPFDPEAYEKTRERFKIQKKITDEEALRFFYNFDSSMLIDSSGIKKGFASIFQFPTNGEYILLYYLEATEAGGPFVLAAFNYSGELIWKLNIYGDFTKFMVKDDEIAYEKWYGVINEDLTINIKSFYAFDDKNTGICYGYYNEYAYRIGSDNCLELIGKKETGKRKFIYDKNMADSAFIKWRIME